MTELLKNTDWNHNTAERALSSLNAALAGSESYQEMSNRLARFISTLDPMGNSLVLSDEDGESMIVYGCVLPGDISLGVYGYWDEFEGASGDIVLSSH